MILQTWLNLKRLLEKKNQSSFIEYSADGLREKARRSQCSEVAIFSAVFFSFDTTDCFLPSDN